MSIDLKLPQLGVEMNSAILVEWLCAEGDPIAEGEPIAIVETDKVTFEIKAPGAGVLRKVAELSEEYAVGDLLAVIATDGETAVNGAAPQRRRARDGLRASPLARRIAAHHGVDLTAVAGSGPRGAIRRRDVEAAMTARAPTHPIMPVPETHAENGVPFSPMRRTIATRMHQSLLTTAQMTDVHEFVVTPLAELRTRLAARAGALGFKVSYMDLLVRAVALALREVPELNATATEDRVTVHADVDLGVAVAIPDGLVVPVLRRADHLGVRAVHAELDRLVERARARDLTGADMAGATFTLTNIGSYGSHFGTPVLNPPQVAILAVGAILERPVVCDGAIVVGRTMFGSLTVDHRVIDGAVAGRFHAALERLFADPELLLLG